MYLIKSSIIPGTSLKFTPDYVTVCHISVHGPQILPTPITSPKNNFRQEIEFLSNSSQWYISLIQ